MVASRLASLPRELAAAIARLLDQRAKDALRRACKALRRAVNDTVTAILIKGDTELPPPALFRHLSAIHFSDADDERLRSLAPALASLPHLASLSTPWNRCRVTTASLEALAAACPRLRELHLRDAGGWLPGQHAACIRPPPARSNRGR
jgi:hypothetical protein